MVLKLFFILTAIIFVADQITKYIVLRWSEYLPIEVIHGIFAITLVRNKGGAFGIFRGRLALFIMVSIVAIVVISILLVKLRHEVSTSIRENKDYLVTLFSGYALALILGGAIGNLVDRLRFGYVVDFLDFKIWPVFNIADSAITTGTVVLFFILALKKTQQNR